MWVRMLTVLEGDGVGVGDGAGLDEVPGGEERVDELEPLLDPATETVRDSHEVRNKNSADTQ